MLIEPHYFLVAKLRKGIRDLKQAAEAQGCFGFVVDDEIFYAEHNLGAALLVTVYYACNSTERIVDPACQELVRVIRSAADEYRSKAGVTLPEIECEEHAQRGYVASLRTCAA